LFEGQGQRPQFKVTEGNVAKVVGATSREGFLVLSYYSTQ